MTGKKENVFLHPEQVLRAPEHWRARDCPRKIQLARRMEKKPVLGGFEVATSGKRASEGVFCGGVSRMENGWGGGKKNWDGEW